MCVHVCHRQEMKGIVASNYNEIISNREDVIRFPHVYLCWETYLGKMLD